MPSKVTIISESDLITIRDIDSDNDTRGVTLGDYLPKSFDKSVGVKSVGEKSVGKKSVGEKSVGEYVDEYVDESVGLHTPVFFFENLFAPPEQSLEVVEPEKEEYWCPHPECHAKSLGRKIENFAQSSETF